MARAAFLPWPTATVTVRSLPAMSPPAKMPGWPVIMPASTWIKPASTTSPGTFSSKREVGVLAQREHHRVGLDTLEFAGRLREAIVVERHLLDHDFRFAGFLDGRQPFDRDAFLQRLLDLEVVRRHLVARAAVDDDRFFGAEALGGARDVDGGVAAAVDDDAATEHGRGFILHVVQHGDRVEHLVGITGRDIGALGDVRADAEETGVEGLVRHDLAQIGHLGIKLEFDTVVEKALDFRVEHIAWQPVFGNAVAHHAAGLLRRLVKSPPDGRCARN